MKYLIFFLPLLLASCFSNVDTKLQAHYIDIKAQFKEPLTKYFPKILPNEFQEYHYSSGFANFEISSFLELRTKYAFKLMYNSVKNKLTTKYLFKISPSNSCIIKVFSGNVWDNEELIQKTKILNSNCFEGFPIPDFVINESNSHDDHIYVIELDTINYFEKSDKPIIKYLPDRWSKGYSLGITTNDENLTINYWLIIW